MIHAGQNYIYICYTIDVTLLCYNYRLFCPLFLTQVFIQCLSVNVWSVMTIQCTSQLFNALFNEKAKQDAWE